MVVAALEVGTTRWRGYDGLIRRWPRHRSAAHSMLFIGRPWTPKRRFVPRRLHPSPPPPAQDAAGNSASVFYYNIAVEEVDVLASVYGSEENFKQDMLERNVLR